MRNHAAPLPPPRAPRTARRRGRTAALVAVLLSALLAVAACGGSGGSGGGNADAAGDGGGSATRTVTDATGTTVDVPAQPESVVTLSELDLDSTLALGVTPVGATAGRGQDGLPGYLADEADNVPLVGTVTGPQLGKVIQADPDLILAGQVRDEQVLSKLREIAPTVVTFRVGDDWKDAFASVAAALGRTDEQESVMADYQATVETVRGELGDHADAVVSVVRWSPKGPSTINQGVFASTVLADLGLQRPPEQMEHAVHSMPLSMENLDQIDADWIFLGTLSTTGPADTSLQDAKDTPAFAALGAAQTGHVVTVDGSKWMSLGGPLAASSMLDDVRNAMAA